MAIKIDIRIILGDSELQTSKLEVIAAEFTKMESLIVTLSQHCERFHLFADSARRLYLALASSASVITFTRGQPRSRACIEKDADTRCAGIISGDRSYLASTTPLPLLSHAYGMITSGL